MREIRINADILLTFSEPLQELDSEAIALKIEAVLNEQAQYIKMEDESLMRVRFHFKRVCQDTCIICGKRPSAYKKVRHCKICHSRYRKHNVKLQRSE